MRTVVISDLHLGSPRGNDVLRLEAPRQALLDELQRADRIVLLGDVVELRGAPVADCLAAARPLLGEIGAAARDVPVVYVPGNHDHQLVAEWLELRRQRGESSPLGLAQPLAPGRSGLMAKVARALGAPGLEFSYPGVWLRPDVYATHGHYLDRHNSIPAVEVLAISVCARISGAQRSGPRKAEDYEAAAAPIYAFDYSIAQSGGPSRDAVRAGSSLRVWRKLNPQNGRMTPARVLLGGVLIPGVVAAVNRAGLGPFSSELTPATLRRAALDAMGEAVSRLEVDAEHVVFGHTHRAGPLADDPGADGWATPGAPRLWNSGSWVHEQALVGSGARRSPYWPGGAVVLEDGGPPRLVNLLRDVPAEALR